MSASSDQFKYQQFVVVGLSVYQKPVRLDVAFPLADIIPLQCIVFVLYW